MPIFNLELATRVLLDVTPAGLRRPGQLVVT
jgi:hypothetical protein